MTLIATKDILTSAIIEAGIFFTRMKLILTVTSVKTIMANTVIVIHKIDTRGVVYTLVFFAIVEIYFAKCAAKSFHARAVKTIACFIACSAIFTRDGITLLNTQITRRSIITNCAVASKPYW